MLRSQQSVWHVPSTPCFPLSHQTVHAFSDDFLINAAMVLFSSVRRSTTARASFTTRRRYRGDGFHSVQPILRANSSDDPRVWCNAEIGCKLVGNQASNHPLVKLPTLSRLFHLVQDKGMMKNA
jgi:hypothetical protein